MADDLTLELIDVDRLRPHEEILPDRLPEVRQQITEDEAVDYPILVDDEFYVILDGHHRYQVLKDLGVRRVPVVKIPYTDDGWVQLETRPNAPQESLTKRAVLRKGLSQGVFPPKSTRHITSRTIQAVDVPLQRLRVPPNSMA